MDVGAVGLNRSSHMKAVTNMLAWGLAGALCVLALHKATAAQATTAQAPPTRGSAVVVELFTSEGCSSCPPADRLLAKLEAEQPVRNVEIIALEEHVDYWNSGDWMDPFSSDSFTLRQRGYAAAIGNGNSYTPQMIVDGEKEFVGSREAQAITAIEQARTRSRTEVTVAQASRDNAGTQTFSVKVGAVPNSTNRDAPEVWIAITEAALHSSVTGGENSGKDLRHASVVRKMRKIGVATQSGSTSYSGEERVKLERDWKAENTRVVIFVQEKKSKRILGAASAKLSE
jgi:hypothetical protein